METALAYELYAIAFELLREPSPCENRLRETCACASIDAALRHAVELAAFDVMHRLPRRSKRHFAALTAESVA